MPPIPTNTLLTDEFLIDSYATCLQNEYLLGIMCDNITLDLLPDKDFQTLQKTLIRLFKAQPKCPAKSVLRQSLSRHKSVLSLLDEIDSDGHVLSTEECIRQLEEYIRQVKFQKTYRDIGDLYNRQCLDEAYGRLNSYAEWYQSFSLSDKDFVNVIDDFATNYRANKAKRADDKTRAAVNSFYIDELDKRNGGRDLRGQLTCFLASTGVGKSHIARWIGKNACQFGGLNVLHIQLEGSQEEVVDAYSASLIGCSSYLFSSAQISDEDLADACKELESISGNLYVKAYSQFGAHITTADIYKIIQDYKKVVGSIDVVIIDSMDLLYMPQSFRAASKDERFNRIEIARSLKDLAATEKVWMVVTYQSTIEDREKLNDENFVLTEYNCSEAKGLSRPLTHLITLNQTSNENKENIMRLHVAKSRFFKKGDPFKIATDYDNEIFYNRTRTLNINKVR